MQWGRGTNFGSSLAATAKVASEIDNIDQSTATSAAQAAELNAKTEESKQRSHTQRSERQRMAWQMALLEQQTLGQGLTNVTGKTQADIMEGPLGKILQGLHIGGTGAGAVLGGGGKAIGELRTLFRRAPNNARKPGKKRRKN